MYTTKAVQQFFLTVCISFVGVHTLFAQWVQTTGPTGGYVTSLAISGTNIFAGTYGGGVFLSTNNGAHWSAVNTGLTDVRVNALALSGTNLFAGTVSGVYRSADNGATWTAANTGMTYTIVRSLAVMGTNLFAGTFGDGVFLSTNNGTNWTARNTGLTHHLITSLAVSDTNLFAGTDGSSVFLSTNNGADWTAASAGFSHSTVNALAVSGTRLFAGSYGGVFVSTNNGTHWTAANTGLANFPVNALAVSDANLFVGSLGSSVWRRPLSEMTTAVVSLSSMPARFHVEQNYPNPFNPSTRIRFSIPCSQFVTLRIFNVLGEQITTLVSESISVGTYQVEWNAHNLPSGVYFYRLEAGTSMDTQKLILLR